jgi:DNA-binding transcriptional ArsR family regulator
MPVPMVAGRPLAEVKAELFRALGHPARVRILEVLATGERSVTELQPEIGLESSHLSQQLAVLRRAGVVSTRKEGSAVIYRLRDPEVVELLASARRLLVHALTESRGLLAELEQESGPG